MNIQSNYANFSPNYSNSSAQDVSFPPELLAQLAAQSQNTVQAQDYGLQGPGQDALLSISEAGQAGAASGASAAGGSGGADPRALAEQLEQQVSSGDLQGALATLEQLQSGRPQGGQKPPGADQIDSLEATLTQQLADGDQQGAQDTLAQIQSTMQQNRPQQQSNSQNQSVDQAAGPGQPSPLSNGQYPGSRQFQRTAPSSGQTQQLLPPFQPPAGNVSNNR